MIDTRCFQCNNSERVFINTAEEMIGGSYKCKFTKKNYNGRHSCHIPLQEKREYNGILHQTCKHCVTYASYCKKHNKKLDDVFWGDTCINFIWKNINGWNIMRCRGWEVRDYELQQLKEFMYD